MELLNKPELTHLTLGSTLKIPQVGGTTTMKMPLHHSPQESIIVGQKGEALLQMPGHDHLLIAGDTFIIPAKKEHALTIIKDLKALAVMGIKSENKFI